MILISDWQRAWRWASVRCMAVAAAIQGSWMFIPDDMKTSIPPDLVKAATVILLLAGILGRVTTKKPPEGDDDA